MKEIEKAVLVVTNGDPKLSNFTLQDIGIRPWQIWPVFLKVDKPSENFALVRFGNLLNKLINYDEKFNNCRLTIWIKIR